MAVELVVVAPFGDHQVGDRITDPVEVEALMERRGVVVPVEVPDHVDGEG